MARGVNGSRWTPSGPPSTRPILQEDVLLPVQHLHGEVETGERRLYLAILEEAINNLRQYPAGNEIHEEAVAWFEGRNLYRGPGPPRTVGREWPCHFENICDHLGLTPEVIRRGVLHRAGHVMLPRRDAMVRRSNAASS